MITIRLHDKRTKLIVRYVVCWYLNKFDTLFAFQGWSNILLLSLLWHTLVISFLGYNCKKVMREKIGLENKEEKVIFIIIVCRKTRNWGQIGQSDIGKTSTLKHHVSLKNMQHTWHNNDFKLTCSQTLMYRFSQINYFPRLDLTLSRLCILRAIGWDLSSGITLKSLNFYCHTIKGNWCFTRKFRTSR